MDLIHDDRADGAQHLPGVLRRQQQVERLGRGHQDVRGFAEHGLPRLRRRVAASDGGRNARRIESHLVRDPPDRPSRLRQILVDVGAERLERRHVEDVRLVRQFAAPRDPLAQELVKSIQKGRERLSRSCGRRDERVLARTDRLPSALLHPSRALEGLIKPPANGWMESGERSVSELRLRDVDRGRLAIRQPQFRGAVVFESMCLRIRHNQHSNARDDGWIAHRRLLLGLRLPLRIPVAMTTIRGVKLCRIVRWVYGSKQLLKPNRCTQKMVLWTKTSFRTISNVRA